MPISWKIADKRNYVHWAEKKYDILVFGMPQKFHYGDGMGSNPNILALPMTFKKAAVHLCMKNPADDCMDEYGHRHGGCGCC